MADEPDDAWRKPYEDMLKSGKPLQIVRVDLPMNMALLPTGELQLDTATYELAGFDRLGILRVMIAPEAIEPLRKALNALENTEDGPPSGSSSPAAH